MLSLAHGGAVRSVGASVVVLAQNAGRTQTAADPPHPLCTESCPYGAFLLSTPWRTAV